MDKPIDIKRRGYLNFFKDGVRDALIEGNADDYKKFSASEGNLNYRILKMMKKN